MKNPKRSLIPTVMSKALNLLGRHLMPALLLILVCSTMAGGQESDSPGPVDPSRFKEVSDHINQLKKLRADLGAGHPRVQEIVRNLKLLEEELRMEQSFSERLAAQLRTTEDELRTRQGQDWEKSQAAEAAVSDQQKGSLPSLETLELLERESLTELQRIDWELASEGSRAKQPLPPDAFQADELRLKALQLTRDLVQLKLKVARDRQSNPGGRSPEVVSQDKLTVQVLSLELGIAEAQLQAAEVDLNTKKQLAKNLPQERVKSLNDRRVVVEEQLRLLPPKKDVAKQLAMVQQSSEQLSQQIRELETQRFQHQAKSVELQELLEVVRQSLSPHSQAKAAPKTIN